MSNFTRALCDALYYWKSILLATFCSLVVALLWGANIGALFPVIQVTLSETSLQQWLQSEVATTERKVEELSAEIDTIGQRVARADGEKRFALESQLAQLESERKNLAASRRTFRRAQPLVERFLPHDPFLTVVAVIVLVIIGTAIKHVFMMLNTLLVARASARIGRSLRVRIFEQAMVMDRAGFAEYDTSGFTTHISTTTEMLSQGLISTFGGAIREPLRILACLAGASLISWRLLLLSLVVAPMVAYLIAWLSKRIKSVCHRTVEKMHSFQNIMLETLGSIQTVQAYGMEETEQRRFSQTTHDLVRLSLKRAFYNALTRPITELLGIGMVGTTIIIGGYLVLNHETHVLGIRVSNRP
ncbi:MAG: ABC transporter transmembrane domain-containing protein, partial [Planctomycetota bacterium]